MNKACQKRFDKLSPETVSSGLLQLIIKCARRYAEMPTKHRSKGALAGIATVHGDIDDSLATCKSFKNE